MINIRRCSVGEIEQAPNLTEVLAEYAAESAMLELGEPKPNVSMYYMLEKSGMFHPIAAFDGFAYGSNLLGFILPIVIELPHYGVVAATVESFFVVKASRKLGIGLLLLDDAKKLAAERGAKALLVSAPVGSILARVLPRKGFRHSNDVFVVGLN